MNSIAASTVTLDRHYQRIQKKYPVVDGAEYGDLVVPTGNRSAPIHRWFHLKEAFSEQLVIRLLKDEDLVGRRGLRILDPYSGVGTTAVSISDCAISGDLISPVVYGIESNGFLQLVGSTKFAAMQTPRPMFFTFAQDVLLRSRGYIESASTFPGLSTFRNPLYFDESDVIQLLRLREAISHFRRDGADPLHASLAEICLGAVIESVSNLRRDGRALRYVPKKVRPTVSGKFLEVAKRIQEDMPSEGAPVKGRILRGDGRRLEGIDHRYSDFDLILFSPPYPNNIDYTEIYKLENWLLGFIDTQESFLKQRQRTVYSHPSILRENPLPSPHLSRDENERLRKIAKPVLDGLAKDKYLEGRRRMIQGYVADMNSTLKSAATRLAPGGKIVYIVGNSVHGNGSGSVVVAADLIMAEIASGLGLSVDRFAVARFLRRRGSSHPFLRESVVVLSKG